MVVKPCLTRVNVIIAKRLVGCLCTGACLFTRPLSESGFPCLLTAGSLPVLRSRGSLTCSSSFQSSALPPSHSPLFSSFLFFLLAVLFPAARQVHCPEMISPSITVCREWYCSGSRLMHEYYLAIQGSKTTHL